MGQEKADQPEGASGQLQRPLLVFDGDCGFCRFWIASWRAHVSSLVDFAPFQEVGNRFPFIPVDSYRESIQLIMPSGKVYSAAQAVFRSLAESPENRWMLWAYKNVPGVALVCEAIYRQIATHRPMASKLTHFLWGNNPEPASYTQTVKMFLRLLGVVYLIAFLSFWTQLPGLIGAGGIMPARDTLEWSSAIFGQLAFFLFPGLAWLNTSDFFLSAMAACGALLSLYVVLGIATRPSLIAVWVLYLSLVNAGGEFMSFQWDALLLETGFLAIFLASSPARSSPSGLFLLLLRWLLFRVMFSSGAVKLLGGDESWSNLTALNFHYWSQPLPTPAAWYFAQLPVWFHKLSCLVMYFVELVVPFFIFAPRRLRLLACLILCAMQVLIALTGNYAFLNLLVIVLCVLLCDDRIILRVSASMKTLAMREACCEPVPVTPGRKTRQLKFGYLVAFVIIVASSCQFIEMLLGKKALPVPAQVALNWVSPWRIVNSYGLFAIMTKTRPEIIVEGSRDGTNWLAYEFKYKPGRANRALPVVAPFHPRLDWQMWSASIHSCSCL